MNRSIRHASLALSIALAAGTAQAQPAGTLNEDFIHRVRPGDTLIGLATTYTGKESNWPALQQLNKVADTLALPVAMELRIPLAMIPEVPGTAQIVNVAGSASINGQQASPGSPLPEGGVLSTGAGGFVTVRLSDDSEITLPPNSTVQLQRLRRFERVPITDTVVSVEEGSMESRVAPEGSGVGRFEIRAPVAVTGVRGTRFRVEARRDGASQAVLEGNVRVQAHARGQAPAQVVTVGQGQGARVGGDGSLLGVQPLLAAPLLGTPQRNGGNWTSSLSPVPGAQAYDVRVSRDAQGMHVVSAQRFTAPDIRFTAPGPGTYYVNVSAVDQTGLAGYEARQPFEGALALLSSDGQAVASGSGGLITLQDY
ncbi:FecR family protein [Bordetella hinzii]|uniref:FecR family protein n=1 Tax=Bordetella hinzii TaxID=103855 RepID=UPI00045A7E96|nr:FecR domain-containing protein [Bordetella hinzii]KCB49763.1 sigma factor regulatory protein, FecR/PupR family [Bordetella hinzii 1277]QWF40947.1 LysM peptidoglycan-binding domain-containing protein [Bordetella hinzii]QWF45495.1 LysM peptidoglycan-binding domain-containing protein [Bordetella hinzii]QWF50031.1 LysM peptidoglycan-binding domain-containing protein [Bordetella hinzii]QWF54566.1 LysM peptidoglycan-binding domain-containing protein [Bordetella hinzii]